jgi:predicted dehydrogenase
MGLADINAAVVGTGFIGVAHVEALRRLGVNVVGVVGSSPERARQKARVANLPAPYDGFDACLADGRVDVVHIASPNHLHFQQAMAVLEAGKHVVCEKPLAVDSTETARLVAASGATDLVNAVCFNIRFYPIVHQMAAMVAAGEVGEPRFIHGAYLQDWMLLETDWNWRLEPDKAGRLRAVADIGSHWLDLARFVSGRRVEEVMAELHTFVTHRTHPEGPVESFASVENDSEMITEKMDSDDAASIMLRFEGGARGQVTVSQVAAGHKNRVAMEVDGADAALAWLSESPDRLWIGHRGRPNEVMARDPGAMDPSASILAAYPAGHVEGFPDTFRGLFSRIYADVEAGFASPAAAYPTFADGHDAVCVTEAVAESSSTGMWTEVRRKEEG